MNPFWAFAKKANYALLEDLKKKKIPAKDLDRITFNFLQGFEYGWKVLAPKCVISKKDYLTRIPGAVRRKLSVFAEIGKVKNKAKIKQILSEGFLLPQVQQEFGMALGTAVGVFNSESMILVNSELFSFITLSIIGNFVDTPYSKMVAESIEIWLANNRKEISSRSSFTNPDVVERNLLFLRVSLMRLKK